MSKSTETKPAAKQQSIVLSNEQMAWLKRNNINDDTWGALQSSIYPGSKPASILLAIQYCRARGLDPLKKPVHIVPMEIKDAASGEKSWRDVVMVGINELLATASRTGEFVGKDAPIYGPEIKFCGEAVPEYCEITVYRKVNGERVPFTAREYMAECAVVTDVWERGQKTGEKKLNYMWGKRPRGQLAKCALASVLRVAFPVELGGTYAAEEFTGAEPMPAGAQGSHGAAAKNINDALGLQPKQPATAGDAEPAHGSGETVVDDAGKPETAGQPDTTPGIADSEIPQ